MSRREADEPGRVGGQTAALLVRCLEAEGVPFVFGIPGGARSRRSWSAGRRRAAVHHRAARDRRGVHGPGVRPLHGPAGGRAHDFRAGVINAVCGVATAQADRDPIVAITGQVPRSMRFKSYHQCLDTVGLFAPITKWSVGIEEPGTIPEVLANAFRTAVRPRPGAVHVSIPSDVSRGRRRAPLAPARPRAGRPASGCRPRPRGGAPPVGPPSSGLLLGVATGNTPATAAIRRLLRRTPLPVACTFEGNGVVPRELLDCFVGRVGYTHNQPADRLLQQADVVACVGYDLIEYDPTEWLGPATQVIHVDEVPATIDRAYRPAVELVGDLGRTIDALAERLGSIAADEAELIREARRQLQEEQSRGAPPGRQPGPSPAGPARPGAGHRRRGDRDLRRGVAPDLDGPVLLPLRPATSPLQHGTPDDGRRPALGDRRGPGAAGRAGRSRSPATARS